MRRLRRIFILTIILSIILLINTVYASTPIIKEKKESGTPIKIEEGVLTKEITNISKENNEITIKLKFDITKQKTIKDNSEIIFLIDNSSSMATKINNSDKTRKEQVVNSTKELIKKINKNNPNAKMGITYFSSNGVLLQELTNNQEQLLNSCENFKKISTSGSTNMTSGINVAKSSFTSEASEKILVFLTDGLPTDNKANVKNALIDENVYIITTLVGLDNATTAQKAIIEEIFGTEEKPVANRFYNIADTDIETTISQNIYDRILEDFQAKLTNIEIKDYFPEEIINNFDISIKNNIKGKAEKNKDSISWKMDILKSGENATLEYLLKLKNNYNQNIINKVLDTNKKVELNYNDMKNKVQSKEMIDSPQIILERERNNSENGSSIGNKENNKANISSNILKGTDNTTANKILSNAGNNGTYIIITIIAIVAVFSISTIIVKKKYK